MHAMTGTKAGRNADYQDSPWTRRSNEGRPIVHNPE